MDQPVTGVMVQYYYTCHRELWFYGNRINMNYDDENIKIGRQIQESSYDQDTNRKNVLIDGRISIDIIQDENTIYEVKKSSALEEASVMQLKYYLWYLKRKKGVKMDGVLAFPEERERREVELTKEDEKELATAVEAIKDIIARDEPPQKERKPFCEACSFYDLCWV